MCMNYFLCKQKQRKLHTHLSVWEIQIWKCYHFSLSTIDNFELKDYIATIICQIVSWYCSFKRPQFQILIKIMDRSVSKKYLSDLKVLEKLKNSIFSHWHWLLFIPQVQSLKFQKYQWAKNEIIIVYRRKTTDP
jgi:hypothetical protein